MQKKNTLLLSCCAPCSCAAIEKLALDKEKFSVLFYNPNIFPQTEYQKRLEENKKFCAKLDVEFIELEYNHEDWLKAVKGLEEELDRGARCAVCFYFRFKRAGEWALENGFTEVSSVLGISRYKDIEQVHAAALRAANETKCPYNSTNYRKNGLEERRQALVKQNAMYDQEYCGCQFSKSQLEKFRNK